MWQRVLRYALGWVNRRLQEYRPVIYRREKPIRWTVDDASVFRAFMESESGKKLLAFQDDAMINALLRGNSTRGQVAAWKYGLEYLLTYRGQKEAQEEPEGVPVPMQFSDEESVK